MNVQYGDMNNSRLYVYVKCSKFEEFLNAPCYDKLETNVFQVAHFLLVYLACVMVKRVSVNVI
jgi:hypothetical protein